MTHAERSGIVQYMNNSHLTGALAAAATAIAFLVLGVVQVTHGAFDGQLTDAVDYANDGSFTVALLGIAVGLTALRRDRDNPRFALEGAVLGAVLVAIGVGVGLALGHSPSWFAAVGVPGNLLLLVNTIRLARSVWREAEWPRWVAVGIGLTVPCGVVLAQTGAPFVLALVWAYVAGRLAAPQTETAPA